MKNAAEYRLHLSMLLKGARGIGKCTAATWVARSLGMHLLDVSNHRLLAVVP
jgi:peroxin-6